MTQLSFVPEFVRYNSTFVLDKVMSQQYARSCVVILMHYSTQIVSEGAIFFLCYLYGCPFEFGMLHVVLHNNFI